LGLIGDDIQIRDRPNQGIWNSLQNSLIFSGISFPFTVLLFVLPRWATGQAIDPIAAILAAIATAFLLGFYSGGGIAGLQHVILRLLLRANGSVPWNYARFLAYADERKLIQQIGGRYRFVHDLLREHFADNPPVRLTQTLTGHADIVRSIAISPDGQWLVSGNDDKTAKLWHFPTGELQHALADCQGAVNCVAFSPDSTVFAGGSDDRSVKVWQIQTSANGKVRVFLKFTLEGHSDEVLSLAISPDGRTLASGSRDGVVKLWNLETGRVQHTLMGHSKWIFSLAFSLDSQTVASGSRDRTIKLWNTKTGDLQQTFPNNPVRKLIRELRRRLLASWLSGIVFSIHFSPHEPTIVSSSAGEAIEIWDIQTGKLRQTTTVHSSCAAPVAIRSDWQLLAAVGNDDRIILYDFPALNALCNIPERFDLLSEFAFTPDGNHFVSASGTIKIWRLYPALWQAVQRHNTSKSLWIDRALNAIITILTLICVIVLVAAFNGLL
jgi:WD40 repeat protein